MRKLLLLSVGLWICAGCRTSYDLTLTNGNRITAARKPKLVNGVYVWVDQVGRTNAISAVKVLQIEPHSRMKSDFP